MGPSSWDITIYLTTNQDLAASSWPRMDEGKPSFWKRKSPSVWAPGCCCPSKCCLMPLNNLPEWHIRDLFSPLGSKHGFDHLGWTSLQFGHQTEFAWDRYSGLSPSSSASTLRNFSGSKVLHPATDSTLLPCNWTWPSSSFRFTISHQWSMMTHHPLIIIITSCHLNLIPGFPSTWFAWNWVLGGEFHRQLESAFTLATGWILIYFSLEDKLLTILYLCTSFRN